MRNIADWSIVYFCRLFCGLMPIIVLLSAVASGFELPAREIASIVDIEVILLLVGWAFSGVVTLISYREQ